MLNTSLFKEFGLREVDLNIATDAYRALFEILRRDPETVVFSATTNYDSSFRAAVETIGLRVDVGSRQAVPAGSSVLAPSEMVPWGDANRVTHVHLHGAVGWYVEQGRILVDPADREFDSRRVPAVLYPDPDKDPLNASGWGVHALWDVFRDAVQSATHVIVIGHSLHDQPLVDVLAGSIKDTPGTPRFAFCHLPDADADADSSPNADAVFDQLRGTRFTTDGNVFMNFVPLEFGRAAALHSLDNWLSMGMV